VLTALGGEVEPKLARLGQARGLLVAGQRAGMAFLVVGPGDEEAEVLPVQSDHRHVELCSVDGEGMQQGGHVSGDVIFDEGNEPDDRHVGVGEQLRPDCAPVEVSDAPAVILAPLDGRLRRLCDGGQVRRERPVTWHGRISGQARGGHCGTCVLPAYANGQRYLKHGGKLREKFSDPDATWGHRSSISTRSGGGYYGYKVHAAVCTVTGLPVAWNVRTAKNSEPPEVPLLLDDAERRGFAVEVGVLDKGYDAEGIYALIEKRGIRPAVPLIKTPAVKAGKHKPPVCDHGEWTFAGSDAKRGASKWCCPTGECEPRSVWVKASRLHPLIPRETSRFKGYYHQRGAVEREFGRLKHEWGLLPLRVRRIERVRLHVDLTILATLADAAVRMA